MGNAQSPSQNSSTGAGDPNYAAAIRAFSKQEVEELRSLFESLAAQSRSDGEYISQSVFQAYFRIPGRLGERMFELVARHRRDGALTFEDLVIAKGTYEKGSRVEIEEFINQLCDVTGDGNLTRSDLEAVLYSMHEAIFPLKDDERSNKDILEIFINTSSFSKEVDGIAEKSMSSSDLESWFSFVPSMRRFLGSLLTPLESGRPGYQVPHLQYPENLSPDMLVLRKEYAWHIGGALSQNDLDEWKLLYHSTINGLSFSTFLGNISNGNEPTILLIKDTEGFIYGGYASQPWERHSDFYGDMKSFLFQLYPKASIYRPTGANKNIQWCAVNFSSESIPNGIGFGGQANHFGLFLSANFDQGHTFTCPTFNNPCLSRTNKINPEIIECWSVRKKGVQNEKTELAKGTILERFKEDRNMLKMVGLANSSD